MNIDKDKVIVKPLNRIIAEGTVDSCPVCGSTERYSGNFFGKKLGCINPDCNNFYNRDKIELPKSVYVGNFYVKSGTSKHRKYPLPPAPQKVSNKKYTLDDMEWAFNQGMCEGILREHYWGDNSGCFSNSDLDFYLKNKK